MLEIKNLHVTVAGRAVLKGLDLRVARGSLHAIMGPNGAGKSTLSYVIAGREGYDVTAGEILLDGKNVLDMPPEERAAAGLFLAFQYPVEIPGVTTTTFLKTALNALRRARGLDDIGPVDFLKLQKEKMEKLGMTPDMLKRGVNVGFSGGEKKRNEVFQMAMLDPSVVVMDETDSGLDIDALKTVSDGVNALRGPDKAFLVITHYQRLSDYIRPDVVHVLADGRICATGGPELALALEEKGYAAYVGGGDAA